MHSDHPGAVSQGAIHRTAFQRAGRGSSATSPALRRLPPASAARERSPVAGASRPRANWAAPTTLPKARRRSAWPADRLRAVSKGGVYFSTPGGGEPNEQKLWGEPHATAIAARERSPASARPWRGRPAPAQIRPRRRRCLTPDAAAPGPRTACALPRRVGFTSPRPAGASRTSRNCGVNPTLRRLPPASARPWRGRPAPAQIRPRRRRCLTPDAAALGPRRVVVGGRNALRLRRIARGQDAPATGGRCDELGVNLALARSGRRAVG